MRLVWNSFLTPPSSDRVKEPFQPLFFCFNRRAYGTGVDAVSRSEHTLSPCQSLLESHVSAATRLNHRFDRGDSEPRFGNGRVAAAQGAPLAAF